jgi:hypothetical protein
MSLSLVSSYAGQIQGYPLGWYYLILIYHIIVLDQIVGVRIPVPQPKTVMAR